MGAFVGGSSPGHLPAGGSLGGGRPMAGPERTRAPEKEPTVRRRHATTPLALITATITATAMATIGVAGTAQATSARGSGCGLDPAHHDITHAIYLQFDNVHFTRDDPNVPSDLEQMPHLLSFLTGNGTLDTDHHTPLIAHTGTDILTSITGVYGDRMGQPISNSYRYFKPDG